MNSRILIKCLAALVPYTQPVGGSSLSGDAYSLQQKLEMISRDPAMAQEIDRALASAICNDPATFDQVTAFVVLCLTQGKRANMQGAWNTIGRVAAQVTQ